MITIRFAFSLVFFCIPLIAFAQDSTVADRTDALNVFLDCQRCDDSYIRTELTYVNYVRDRHQADVHVLVTDQRTGSRGREYTFTYIGQGRFTGTNDTLVYISPQTDTEDDTRKGMVRSLERGLFRYVLHTPQGAFLTATFTGVKDAQAADDPWDYWVFRANANTFLHGQSSSSNFSGWAGLTANRTTEDWKIRFQIETDYDLDEYEYDESGVTVRERFIQRRHEFEVDIVGSIDDHWSAGGELEIFSSSYRNIRSGLIAAPGIEYNYFPYSESTRRMLTGRYKLGVVAHRYVDRTIYGYTEETRPAHEVRISLDLRQPWGSTHVSVTGLQYLHDPGKHSINLNGDINVRIYEGFSFNIHGSYSQIRDQISLPAGGASEAEVLTQKREIATNYNYFGSFGFSYSFGSIYNNVVNARM